MNAAKQGNTLAAATMHLLYKDGDGVPLDPVQAYKWICIASSLNDGDTKAALRKWRDSFATKLTSKERSMADKLTKEFLETYKRNIKYSLQHDLK